MANYEDACAERGPTEGFGMTGDGCLIGDRDNDRVPDNQNNCANTTGERKNYDCPCYNHQLFEKAESAMALPLILLFFGIYDPADFLNLAIRYRDIWRSISRLRRGK
jgi:hypothetical protein